VLGKTKSEIKGLELERSGGEGEGKKRGRNTVTRRNAFIN